MSELYRKQMELYEQTKRRESLSALSLAITTPRYEMYACLYCGWRWHGMALGGFTFLLPQAYYRFVDDKRGQTGLDGHRAPLDVIVSGPPTLSPTAEAARNGAALHSGRQGLEGLESKDGIGEPERLGTANRGGKNRSLIPAASQEEPEAAKSVPQTRQMKERKDMDGKLRLIFRPLRFRKQERLPTAVRFDAVHHGAKPGTRPARLEGAQGTSSTTTANYSADIGSEATEAE